MNTFGDVKHCGELQLWKKNIDYFFLKGKKFKSFELPPHLNLKTNCTIFVLAKYSKTKFLLDIYIPNLIKNNFNY
jgi:hypothetical protein